MSCLVKMRAMREELSVNERRLADFILENTSLLRDYSSQQLADAVGVSQSSVVKFSQKLGYKGYPSLKLAVYETYATEGNGDGGAARGSLLADPKYALSALGQKKLDALENTVRINEAAALEAAVAALRASHTVLVASCAGSSSVARYFSQQLQELGYLALFAESEQIGRKLVERFGKRDLLCIISDISREESFTPLAKRARELGARVLSVTRYNHNAVSINADIRLFVAPADDERGIQRLLYRSAQLHLVESLLAGLLE
jgi:DNA-binding MurR/RpiR family transcriptional regulator